jgi:pimeloyl-ACP methyl ester carboxylesterase
MSEPGSPIHVSKEIGSDQTWLAELFEMADLPPESDLETIKNRMSALANRSAPITRSKWNLIVFLQGLAVCVPLGWLLGAPVQFVGLAVFATTLSLFVLTWWLRARSMQKTWARARLVAEVARSLIATVGHPEAFPWQTVAMVPSLEPLRRAVDRKVSEPPFQEWIEQYISGRLAIQKKYFSEKRNEAEVQRKKLTFWTTVLLDVALVFAVVGVILVFIPRPWMVGGTYAQHALGSLSVVLLLGLLLIQILRDLHELNRRTARFAQQAVVLSDAIPRLKEIQRPEAAAEIVRETEGKLLAEVVDWYFHAETAERFVQLRDPAARPLPAGLLRPEKAATRFARVTQARAGSIGLSVLGAVVTRLPLIVLSAIGVVLWISYWMPQQGSDYNAMERSVELRDRDDRPSFNPTSAEARGGMVVMVHGLYGRGILTGNPDEDARNWMYDCAQALKTRLKNDSAAICLVNWSDAARPWQFFNFGLGRSNLIGDIAAIRPQAYVVGDVVAFKLAAVILKNRLNEPRPVPIHLVGHSAGGFVVARVARRLTEMGLVPEHPDPSLYRVTILDTPEPDDQIFKDLPWATDFYLTSYNVYEYPYRDVLRLLGAGSNQSGFHPVKLDESVLNDVCNTPNSEPGFWLRLSRKTPIIRNGERFWVAHRAACCWFRRTIENPDAEPRGEGFNKSPLLLNLKTANAR